jgi:hypothetical protein
MLSICSNFENVQEKMEHRVNQRTSEVDDYLEQLKSATENFRYVNCKKSAAKNTKQSFK